MKWKKVNIRRVCKWPAKGKHFCFSNSASCFANSAGAQIILIDFPFLFPFVRNGIPPLHGVDTRDAVIKTIYRVIAITKAIINAHCGRQCFTFSNYNFIDARIVADGGLLSIRSFFFHIRAEEWRPRVVISSIWRRNYSIIQMHKHFDYNICRGARRACESEITGAKPQKDFNFSNNKCLPP